jgi:peroxiredoxin
MKRRLSLALVLIVVVLITARADESSDSLVKTGDPAPAFTVTTTGGAEISTAALRGQVILVNFFATWCGPCMEEMPHLEADVWNRFKGRGLVVVAIGREHGIDELKSFKAGKKLTFPIAADQKREVYGKYAKQYIPRNFLIGADGRVVFESVGFNDGEFKEMIAIVEKELDKRKQ